MYRALAESNRHHALFDRGLGGLEKWLMANRGLIKAKFSEASRYTPVFLDNYVVEKFVDGICALLHEVAANPVARGFGCSSTSWYGS